MAISIDALLAIVIFLALVAFISIEPISEAPITQQQTTLVQRIDDAIAAMDSTGFFSQKIDNRQSQTTEEIEADVQAKLESLLPSTIGFRLEMLQYESNVDDPTKTCRQDQTFESCFPVSPDDLGTPDVNEANPKLFFEVGTIAPSNKEIFHGEKIFLKKEPGDCHVEQGLSQKKTKEFTALFQGNHRPEARDVNITTGATCPGTRQPCPATDDTMRCCYVYYDQDNVPAGEDPQSEVKYAWYKYDSSAEGDKWLPVGTNQTLALTEANDTNRFKCSVWVKDSSGETETEWSSDTNSPFAIIGGPCFQFSSSLATPGSPQLECGETGTVTFTISAEAGEREQPLDIMLSMDRSGSMSWNDVYDNTTVEGIFVETGALLDTAYFGNDSYVYKLDANKIDGSLSYKARSPAIDYAYGVFVDDSYVFVADNDAGLTILNKSDLSKIRSIGEAGSEKEMTTARGVFVSGDYAYVAAAGTYVPGAQKKYTAQMTNSRTSGEEEYIGYNASRSWVAQSFKPKTGDINGVEVEVRKIGSPGNLTVHIRSSLTGADLPNGTIIVSAGSISTSWGWRDVPFPSPGVDVNPNDPYYLVLTTTTQSTGNYYQWGTRRAGSDNYADGKVYRCNSSGSCAEQDDPTWYDPKYEDTRFRVYSYLSMVGGLVIVDKSSPDPNNWHIESNLYSTTAGFIDQPQDVVVAGNYAYLADQTGVDSAGLWVINVADKANPTFAGFRATSNAYGVDVSGDYAYVTNKGGNFHVINVQNKSNPTISKTFTNLGDTEDVFVDGTKAYVTANSVGTGSTITGVHVIDITNPPQATKIETFYSPYGNIGRLFVGEKFIFTKIYGGSSETRGLITIDKLLGTKMNISRNSAKEFILYEDWESPQDKLGVVSFGSNPDVNLNNKLVYATSELKAEINGAIDFIQANGSTPMHAGFDAALDEILDSGRGRQEAMRFIILLSDGQCNIDCSSLSADATRARNNNVYVFTIGLGGDVADAELQTIADNSYCPDKANGDCGSYHHINDPNALDDIYEIIAQKIAELSGRLPDRDTTDMEMTFSGFDGLDLSNFNPAPASWQNGVLTYSDIDIRFGWAGSFNVTIPCDYDGCDVDFTPGKIVQFPPASTEISFTLDGEQQPAVEWPEKFIAEGEFYYKDIVPRFWSGYYDIDEGARLEYSVENIGYADVDLDGNPPVNPPIVPTVAFYELDSPSQPCGDGSVAGSVNFDEFLDAAYGINSNGLSTSTENKTSQLQASGWICIWLNKNKNANECTYNNRLVVNCAIPETHVYALDYWAWEK